MKKITLVFVLFFTSIAMNAQENTAQDPWVAYMTPSAFHKVLGGYTGEWRMDVTMWMAPGAAPVKTSMKSTHGLVSNGLFLEMNQLGDMMGMPFTARILLGFNNSSKEVELNSYTNMGSGMTSLRGKWDETKKTADLKGVMSDPVSGKAISIRQLVSFPDDKTLVIENFDTSGSGPERKTMEFRCTRA